jgi:hypothetical protein
MRTRIDFDTGWIEYDQLGGDDDVRVGDRLFPRAIDVTFPGVGGQPRLTMRVDSSSGVPRCTRLVIESIEGGREVRTTDVRAVEVDNWLDVIVPATAAEIVSELDGEVQAVIHVPRADSDELKAARDVFRGARRAARRRINDKLLRQVAEAYNSDDQRPAKAVQRAFAVKPRTAYRYIEEARRRGFMAERETD